MLARALLVTSTTMTMDDRSPDPGADNEWIALPGLFEEWELVSSPELEMRALPLVIVQRRVLYGVYVRERVPSHDQHMSEEPRRSAA